MEVYEFDKSLLTRLQESCNVLQCKESPIAASAVRQEWACHVEFKIEPAGWQAIWKINRATCEELMIKYPTIVYGTVNNILFRELKADFEIIAVQDDDIHLPEMHEVPLEDLWPTIKQENSELNIERTADCLDEYRFFFRNVWMPWDDANEDDVDWCKNHLETRIRFCFDLKRGMSRAMADHIRKILAEARYIQTKRETIEMEVSDDEALEEDEQKVNDIMRMQLRLIEIRNEIEMLQDPALRKVYEDVHFKVNSKKNTPTGKPSTFIVTKRSTINNQIEYLQAAEDLVSSNQVINMLPSLMDCFKIAASHDHIYIPIDRHTINLLEPLNSNGFLKAIGSSDDVIQANEQAIIVSEDNNSVLMVFNGDYTIENVCFDCGNVRLGLWCKRGTVTLKNCRLSDPSNSTNNNGILIADGAKCILENSIISNFADGITCSAGSNLFLKYSEIKNCEIGLRVEDEACIECISSTITNSTAYGILYKTTVASMTGDEEKKKHFENSTDFKALLNGVNDSLVFDGDCSFKNNQKSNIVVMNKAKMSQLQYSEFLEDDYTESGLTNEKKPSEIRMDISK